MTFLDVGECRDGAGRDRRYGDVNERQSKGNEEYRYAGDLVGVGVRKATMRFGVFSDAQQEADVEERFVRAKIAADRVKDDPQAVCGYC